MVEIIAALGVARGRLYCDELPHGHRGLGANLVAAPSTFRRMGARAHCRSVDHVAGIVRPAMAVTSLRRLTNLDVPLLKAPNARPTAWRTAAGIALCILAVELPFDVVNAPIFGGRLMFTNVKASTAVVVVLWLVALVRERRLATLATPLNLAVGLFGLTVITSGLVAPFYRGDAIKFGVGIVGMLGLVPCTADLARDQRVRKRLVACLLAGAAISAGIGLVAYAAGAELPSWLSGGAPPNTVDSSTRVQSTFGYPTIAAMYWEAALVVGIALLNPIRAGGTLLAAAGLAMTGTALVLTGSRGGVVGALVGLTLIVWLSNRLGRRTAAWPAAAVAVLLILMAVVYYSAAVPLPRLFTENTSQWYGAEYRVPEYISLPAGSRGVIPVTVRNTGLLEWHATGPYAVELSYHIADAGGDNVITFDGARTVLPHDVSVGSEVSVLATVTAPIQAATYTLVWDMVEQDVTWFISRGVAAARTQFNVAPSTVSGSSVPNSPDRPGLTISGLASQPVDPGRLRLWHAGALMLVQYPLLGVGPGNFRLLYGGYLGNQIWDTRLHANSLYVEQAATTGVLGLLALLLVLGIAVGSQLRRLLSGSGAALRDQDLLLSLCLLGAVAAFLVHGLVDYFLGFMSTGLLLWLLVGFGAAATSAVPDTPSIPAGR